jgi:hypothetical protein
MTSPLGFELTEYRDEDSDGYIFTRIYQLTDPIGPIKYIKTMTYGGGASNPHLVLEDGICGVRGRPRISPDKSIWQDIEALDALDDAVVNEVAVIPALPDSDEAHEYALTIAYGMTLEYWDEYRHLAV